MSSETWKAAATTLIFISLLSLIYTERIQSATDQTYTTPAKKLSYNMTLLWTHDTIDGVNSVFLTKDEGSVITGGMGFIKRLESETGREVWNLEKPYQVDCMASTDDGSYTIVGLEQARLLVITEEGLIYWNLDTEGPVLSAAITVEGSRAAFGTFFGTLYLAEPIHRYLSSIHKSEGHAILKVDVSSDGSLVAAAYSDDSITAFKWGEQKALWKIDIEGHAKVLAYSPGKDKLLAGSSSGLLYALSPWNGEILWTFRADEAVSSIAFFDDNSKLAVGSHDGYVYILSLDDGSKLKAYHSEGDVKCVAYIEEGSLLCLGGTDRRFRAFNVDTDEELGTIKAGYWITSMSTVRNGSTVVFGAGKAVYGVRFLLEEQVIQSEVEVEEEEVNRLYPFMFFVGVAAALGVGGYLILKRLGSE